MDGRWRWVRERGGEERERGILTGSDRKDGERDDGWRMHFGDLVEGL